MIKKQVKDQHVKKQRKNRGSAIIEMTMLIPVYLGTFYFYIMFFLFLIECGFVLQNMIECIYDVETKFENQQKNNSILVTQQGNVQVVRASNMDKVFQIHLELKGNTDDFTEKIRRWQIAVDTIS